MALPALLSFKEGGGPEKVPSKSPDFLHLMLSKVITCNYSTTSVLRNLTLFNPFCPSVTPPTYNRSPMYRRFLFEALAPARRHDITPRRASVVHSFFLHGEG